MSAQDERAWKVTDRVEVFADISCPFTHLGLNFVSTQLADAGLDVEVWVRAWPLEWVNGTALDGPATATKIEVLRAQLGNDHFTGFRLETWPRTTIPALNLVAEAYVQGAVTGLAVSLELRALLFEQGMNVSAPDVLAALAARHGLRSGLRNGLHEVGSEPHSQVVADYEEGLSRGVTGSPHFWVDEQNFFCPSLAIGHEPDGTLTATFDSAGLTEFMTRVAPDAGFDS